MSARARHKPRSRRPYESPLDKAKAHEVVWPEVSDIFEASRRYLGQRFVYFMGEENDGPLKIGVAKDPIARLRGCQTGNPRRLCIERVVVGDHHLEKLLHQFWERFAIVSATNRPKADAPPGTEWFRPEIREDLFPILGTAAAEQSELLNSAPGDLTFGQLEQAVRDAHKAHGFVVYVPHQTRLLAAKSGYIVRRPSRL